MRATVTMAFRDADTWVSYSPGDAYDGDQSRIERLSSLGLVAARSEGDATATFVDDDVDDGQSDLMGQPAAVLRALCAERGVRAPARATKARLLELLQEQR